MSGGEIIVIFLVMLLLFGSKKLPDLARTLGRGMREFQKAKDEITNELNRTTADVRADLAGASHEMQSEVDQLKKELANDLDALPNDQPASNPDIDGQMNVPDAPIDGVEPEKLTQ